MSERPTPETDEQINGKPCTRFAIAAGDSLRDALVPSEFARKLERERDEAREERDALRDAVNALHDYVHGKRNDGKDISEILNGVMKI